MKLAEIQHAIEELPEDQQTELTTWVIRRDPDQALRMVRGEGASHSSEGSPSSDLRELRGAGGIRPDFDYKSLRIGSTQR
jgi:hypothetical protein